MSDTNRVFIMGRLTKDAQLKTNPNGLETAHFSIANNRSKSIRTEHGGRPLISST